MEDSQTGKYARSEKSLSTLTRKFLEMLQNSKTLDLNTATEALEVSKKRRIYDITNVMEGCSLIKKVGKNLYSWCGKTAGEDDSIEENKLKEHKDDRKRLRADELELNEAIKAMKQNLGALQAQSLQSYCYMTKNDFLSAFGVDSTILIAKDYKKIKFKFDDTKVISQRPPTFKYVNIVGDVVKPAQLKLVNSQSKDCDSNLLFCLDEMASEEDETKVKNSPGRCAIKKRNRAPERLQSMNLFRRRMKMKKFIDLPEEEREQLANTLEVDKYKSKSMFHYINEKQLVLPSDYIEPDFIPLSAPPETHYEENYSSSGTPSVYDLFDIDAKSDDYEMLEYLDEEL